MATIDITSENLDETLKNNKIVLLEIFAPWCGHCRQYTPTFKKVSDEHTDIVFGLVNCDVEKNIPKTFQVAGVPTTISFKNGVKVDQKAGGMTEEALKSFVDAAKNG